MAWTAQELTAVRTGNVVNRFGDKLGSVGELYSDNETGDPTWVTVKTGLFGTSQSFVPLSGASVSGSDLVVDYDKDTIKDAPRIDADTDLSPEEEQRLYDYYKLGGGDRYGNDRNVKDRDVDVSDTSRSGRRAGGYDKGADRGDDDAMTLSEEQLRVGTQTRESGRARLRKYVVTENVTQTVPVSREEVRVEREPITEANRGQAMSGADISEDEHEVVLHEERPVVQKEAVPVERVRLDTETVTDEVTVNEEVRKEQLDTDIDGSGDRRTDRTDR